MEIDEQLITKHLDIWSSVKKARSSAGRGSNKKLELYGIAKLRGLILDLAVRGLLVPQENNDEPAANLIERITKEKSNLVKQGKLKNTKKLTPVSAEEAPFKTAPNWEWTRLGEVLIKITDGTHHSPPNSESGDYRYISAKNIKKDGIQLNNTTWIPKEIHDEIYSRCDPEKGDILYIKDGATTGIATINDLDEPFSMLSSVALLKCPKEVLNSYLLLSLRSPYFYREMRSEMTGVAITRVTLKKLNYAFISLPPLAEQHRIVAKVDELMALCDQLEEEQENNLDTHETLVSSLLNALTSAAADASQFAAAWQRIQANFDILFITESSVDQLKQTILQLAVMGKLVPQDPEDDSAAELLKKVADEKERLVKEKKIKKPKPLTAISSEEEPYTVPSRWEWCRLGELSLSSDSGWSPQCNPGTRDNEEQWGVLKVSAVSWGEFRADEHKKLPVGKETRPECEVKNGDFLLSRANTEELVARGVVVVQPPPRLMMSDKIVRFSISEQISKIFINLANASDSSREYYKANSSGTSSSMKNVTRETMSNLPIPVPPLNEQHRIVAKVDELIGLCDQLKVSLASAQNTQINLADSLVEQAIQ